MIALGCIPFNLTIAPKREFIVVTTGNEPIEGALARQIWYQYSLGYRKEEDLRSDSIGKVLFPKRVVRTTLLSMVSGAIAKIAWLTINASLRSTDSIVVLVEGHDSMWCYDGIGLESGVVAFGEQDGTMLDLD